MSAIQTNREQHHHHQLHNHQRSSSYVRPFPSRTTRRRTFDIIRTSHIKCPSSQRTTRALHVSHVVGQTSIAGTVQHQPTPSPSPSPKTSAHIITEVWPLAPRAPRARLHLAQCEHSWACTLHRCIRNSRPNCGARFCGSSQHPISPQHTQTANSHHDHRLLKLENDISFLGAFGRRRCCRRQPPSSTSSSVSTHSHSLIADGSVRLAGASQPRTWSLARSLCSLCLGVDDFGCSLVRSPRR